MLKLCSAGAQIVLGQCSNCARLVLKVLKLCSAGAQIVLGWCSNCAQLVLELCSAGAQIVLDCCSNCAPQLCRKSARCCQNAKNTTRSDPLEVELWKKCTLNLKHILKSCQKHYAFGPLLDVEMRKKCTLLWRKAHFEVNM